mgnify:CR=1 FL=1
MNDARNIAVLARTAALNCSVNINVIWYRVAKIEIFRTGYYDGRGARLTTTLGPLDGKPQPTPPVGPRRLPAAAGRKPDDGRS